jgi:hypothetical protein
MNDALLNYGKPRYMDFVYHKYMEAAFGFDPFFWHPFGPPPVSEVQAIWDKWEAEWLSEHLTHTAP